MAYTSGHLSKDETIGLANDTMVGEERRLATDHLQECELCRNLVSINRESVTSFDDEYLVEPPDGDFEDLVNAVDND